MQYFAEPERHDYELVYTTHRQSGFWQRSNDVETHWHFTSQRPAGDHEMLPLINVDYDLPLSSLNTAPPGPFSFGVAVPARAGCDAEPDHEASRVEVSWNGGSTWSRCSQPAASAPRAPSRSAIPARARHPCG